MTSGIAIDHLVLRVADLAAAMDDWRRLGFSVAAGGRHPAWGSRNAIVPFTDDSYIELIEFAGAPPGNGRRRGFDALRSGGRALREARVLSWSAAGEGWVDYALVPADIEAEVARCRVAGITVDGPFPGERARPDGQRVAWRMVIPEALDVPFLVSDVTPRGLRVPEGEARRHANGSAGISRLTVWVESPASTRDRLAALLDVSPAAGTQSTELDCNGVGIRLLQPAPGEHDFAVHGPVLAEVELAARGIGAATALDMKLAHGGRLVLVPDH